MSLVLLLALSAAPVEVRVLEREVPSRVHLEAARITCDGRLLPGTVDAEASVREVRVGEARCVQVVAEDDTVVSVAVKETQRKYAGQVRFISVGVPSNQSAEKQKAYMEKQQLGGTFVFDKDGAAMKAFAVPHTSYVVVIDKAGKVAYTGVGAEQDIDAAVQKAIGR